MDTSLAIRRPVVAGQFYPAQPSRLSREIETYLEQVETDRSGLDIQGMVVPHAGYIYSGPVAAYAYAQVRGKSYDSVAVVAPSHRGAFAFSSVFGGKSYVTPLGEVLVDRESVAALEREGGDKVRVAPEGHTYGEEHSLEVQLPFLQSVLGEFSLVPVVMGAQSREACECLAHALAAAFRGRRTLIVASTDLSHYHSQGEAERLDSRVVERIDSFDPEELLEDIAGRKAEACGAGPVCASMLAARELGADHGENLCYMTSGARSGDFSHVVGYTAGIFYRTGKA